MASDYATLSRSRLPRPFNLIFHILYDLLKITGQVTPQIFFWGYVFGKQSIFYFAELLKKNFLISYSFLIEILRFTKTFFLEILCYCPFSLRHRITLSISIIRKFRNNFNNIRIYIISFIIVIINYKKLYYFLTGISKYLLNYIWEVNFFFK